MQEAPYDTPKSALVQQLEQPKAPVSAPEQNARFGPSQRPPGYVKVKYQGRARNHRPPGDAVRAPQSMDGAKANVEHGRADMSASEMGHRERRTGLK